MKVAITGANGNLGRRLVSKFESSSDDRVRAIVRSERAGSDLKRQLGDGVDVSIVDYADESALAVAVSGFDVVIHLVGIIKESTNNTFQSAHEESCNALVGAASNAGVKKIVHLSISGSNPLSDNACLRSRGIADKILNEGPVDSLVIRVPMVLGEGDYASMALKRQACSRFAFTFRAASLEQPIYAGDVVAVLARGATSDLSGIYSLGGPESLSRKSLILRASKVMQVPLPVVVSLPISVGFFVARLLELTANPPITRAMLGVLDHDDEIDSSILRQALDLPATSLDDALGFVLTQKPIVTERSA